MAAMAVRMAFNAITDWVIAALAASGVPEVVQHGVSDLVLHERKIGGSCVYRTRGLLYYSTTLLCEPKMPLVDRYLLHPPREPEYRQGRPHTEFMGSLQGVYGLNSNSVFLKNLNRHLSNSLESIAAFPSP